MKLYYFETINPQKSLRGRASSEFAGRIRACRPRQGRTQDAGLSRHQPQPSKVPALVDGVPEALGSPTHHVPSRPRGRISPPRPTSGEHQIEIRYSGGYVRLSRSGAEEPATEAALPWTMAWVRHHDKYENAGSNGCCHS